jgi:hypothetical protein
MPPLSHRPSTSCGVGAAWQTRLVRRRSISNL